ncbi:MAG TPA: helix-turn-helix domain-containing protein, partial [Ohtaekwangia sp.]
MPESLPVDNEFLNQVRAIVEKNIANEQFGVSELADQTNMSRSNLLRKVKKLTNLSVSQLISQVRLQRGMELLKTSSLNVSEISHQVGFSSTSYFIKCFREYYGYPPGEVGKRAAEQLNTPAPDLTGGVTTPGQLLDHVPPKRKFIVPASLGLLIGLAIALFAYFSQTTPSLSGPEKSIAVLPFKNDSNDSTNVYLINGLMESTLNNLQQIKDLRVISRTTAEKYRNTNKSIPEMAKELGVNYFVEGSGQKIGDRILLNIQLIEASTDKHLWSKQYRREAKDIFELQQEVAKNIAQEIQAVITPEEEKQIEKIPTENLEAYDLYLKG